MLGKCSVTELNLWPAVSLLTLWILGSKRLYLLSNLTGSLLGKCALYVREGEWGRERGRGSKRGERERWEREERKREREKNFTSQSILLRTLPCKQFGLQASL